jgi:hypothetical protein
MLETKTDRRHDRRALEPGDFYALLAAAKRGAVVEGLDGPTRSMLYLLAGWTGYRRKELASLTRRSFDLDGTHPNVKVRTDSVPLHPVVVEWFREWIESQPGLGMDEPIFPLRTRGGSWRRTNVMMRTDLEAAGLPYQDEAGLFADFHSNRHTFISNLGRAGVSITMAQQLARHSTPTLTANVYTHLGLGDKADAIASLPAPEMPLAFQVNDNSDKDLGTTAGCHGVAIERRQACILAATMDGNHREREAGLGCLSTVGGSPEPVKRERVATVMDDNAQPLTERAGLSPAPLRKSLSDHDFRRKFGLCKDLHSCGCLWSLVVFWGFLALV